MRVCHLALLAMPLLTASALSAAELKSPGHPFILWTRAEAEGLKRRTETQPLAKARLDELIKEGKGQVLLNLFRYSVLGEADPGKAEKDYLLSFIGAKVDGRTWSDNYLTALRYDVLYDELTPEQRAKLEETFRQHAAYELAETRAYAKCNWLPNMMWCRKLSVCLMAVAMQDEKLIRDLFAANGGWKYYFDDYLSDGRFYQEEFGKQYSMNGEMLLWCRGVERLGLDELGYGYTGKGGATMRRNLASYFDLGYGSVDLGTERRAYPILTMGDAKGHGPAWGIQHVIAPGVYADGHMADKLWSYNNMNGRDHKDRIIEKFHTALWFELGHQKWPDAGFDYFLAQLRPPGAAQYVPTPFFGLDPIDATQVKPPPAPSGAWPERGFSMLRAEEGPAFWESPAPVVAVRWATNYAHGVKDCFSLMGYYCFNRPLYVNRACSPGYAGLDPTWSNGIRSHSGVMVDNREPDFIAAVPVRSHFSPLAKFTAATAEGVYPGVTQTRALVLTHEYLFDAFQLRSATPRNYLWQIQTLGRACPDNASEWAATRNLLGYSADLEEEQSCVVADRDWAITAVQYTGGGSRGTLGERWFQERYGVRLSVLGGPGTVAYTAWGPAVATTKDRIIHGAEEPGGRFIGAARNARETAFIALHEPFRGAPFLLSLRRIQETPQAIAVAVEGPYGSPVRDRVLVRYENAGEPLTLADGTEAFTFQGYAFVHIGWDGVAATGDLRACRLRAPSLAGKPLTFTLNGKAVAARQEGADVLFGELPADAKPVAGEPPVALAPKAGPIAAFWQPEIARLPTGGEARVKLRLRNNGACALSWFVDLRADAGLTAEPARVSLDNFAPGEEREVEVLLRHDATGANKIGTVSLVSVRPEGGKLPYASVEVQPAPLKVACGVCIERAQFWPRDIAFTLYAPRYVARYHYLETCAASFLLDPNGQRRHGVERGGRQELYPSLRVLRAPPAGPGAKTDAAAAPVWQDQKAEPLTYWSPGLRKSGDGPAVAIESGVHPHFPHGCALEHRWTEDFIIVWYRWDAQEVEMDWSSSWVGRAGGKCLIHTGEKTVDGADLKSGPARAMLFLPAGTKYGEATFYPAGAKIIGVADKKAGGGPRVAFAGNEPMAFTFCTEEEFPALCEKWLKAQPIPQARPRQQGDAGR